MGIENIYFRMVKGRKLCKRTEFFFSCKKKAEPIDDSAFNSLTFGSEDGT